MALDTLYAFTRIDHGSPDGKLTHYEPGDVVDIKLFTKDELKGLVEVGAVSKVNRVAVETPEITVEEIEAAITPKP
jgi:hypothetical protein